MLDQAVPCVNATQWETTQEKHLTWNENRICQRCDRITELFAQRRKIAEQFEEDMLDDDAAVDRQKRIHDRLVERLIYWMAEA